MATGFTAPPVESIRDAFRLREWISNILLQGKLNATGSVTLTANAGTTTYNDPRIGASTVITFSPLTANAAGAVGGLYVSAQGAGTASLTHANTATIDRTFGTTLIG